MKRKRENDKTYMKMRKRRRSNIVCRKKRKK